MFNEANTKTIYLRKYCKCFFLSDRLPYAVGRGAASFSHDALRPVRGVAQPLI